MARRTFRPASQRTLLYVAMAAILVDQFGKWAVVRAMRLDMVGQIDVWPPYLRFRYGENRGINFGVFDNAPEAMPKILIAVSLALVAAVWIWVVRRRKGRAIQIAAGLLIGGALGNVIDRLAYGHVLDFLNMSCCGIDNPYVFNLADVFIFAGAVGLALFDTGSATPPRRADPKKRS